MSCHGGPPQRVELMMNGSILTGVKAGSKPVGAQVFSHVLRCG
jgi:hypothetical protein